jgi:hypothetical protein
VASLPSFYAVRACLPFNLLILGPQAGNTSGYNNNNTSGRKRRCPVAAMYDKSVVR